MDNLKEVILHFRKVLNVTKSFPLFLQFSNWLTSAGTSFVYFLGESGVNDNIKNCSTYIKFYLAFKKITYICSEQE